MRQWNFVICLPSWEIKYHLWAKCIQINLWFRICQINYEEFFKKPGLYLFIFFCWIIILIINLLLFAYEINLLWNSYQIMKVYPKTSIVTGLSVNTRNPNLWSYPPILQLYCQFQFAIHCFNSHLKQILFLAHTIGSINLLFPTLLCLLDSSHP